MNRDPLYRKIVERLVGPLDGNAFQKCAAALVGKAHPNLAPMPGGNDAGMDGAFGSPDGRYPLICTVQDDVIGNFRSNISTYLRKHSGPARAVVATSQALSNAQKRNLEAEASKLGVTLVNIYDAPYFADQLYRDSKWRLELLGVTGDPPALSTLPRVGRFMRPEILIGRDDDLEWLNQIHGDALLVGQPGSGKTYLHQHLASQGRCLFAADDDLQRLADGIREQQPSVIVVDDAHICLRLVEDLKRLRAELGATFDIHLNCWPRQEAIVQRVLDIPESSVRRLQPLRRQEIFDLIKELGINGPDWLQHLLISQADGKPGLAVALAEMCKVEDVARIWSGEAAAQQLLGDLRLVRDEHERCVLAAFAVGGDAGMTFAQVSSALGLTMLQLRQITARLGSGGLIEEVADDRLQVRPPAIRPVLVRDIFYCGPSSLPIGPLLEGTCSTPSTASVLLSARQRGAKVDQHVLEAFVRAANTRDTWEHFAWVNAECADIVLKEHPEQVCNAAPGLLKYLPSRALHALLDADDANLVQQQGAIEHPRRRIREWLFSIDEDLDVTIERRIMLLSVLEERVRQNRIGKGTAFSWALAEVLQASFDVTKLSPGNPLQFNSIQGVAPRAILEKIAALWPRVRDLVPHAPNAALRKFFDQLENWCLPQRLSLRSPLSSETHEWIRANGCTMLSDVLGMANCNRAWRTWAAKIAKWGKLNLKISVDPTFDALYADRDYSESWQEEQQRRISELRAITDELIRQPMADVLTYLAKIRAEAVEFGHRNVTGYLWVVYQHIAKTCTNPMEWVDSLIARNAPSEFVIPLADRLSVEDVGHYERVLHRLMLLADYQPLAINRVLRLPTPNEDLLSMALRLLDDSELAEHIWPRDSEIPLTVMARLLEHSNEKIRAAAAIGEWQRDPDGSVRAELESRWRIALRSVDSDHYALDDIFEKNPGLAFDWLQSQLLAGRRDLWSHDLGVVAAAKNLDKAQRADLLRLFIQKNYNDDCFDLVIGEHIDLFADWLRHQTDEYLRLRPLDRHVGSRWEQMALLALDAGVSPEKLAEHCTSHHWGGFGPLSEHFAAQIPAYEALANHADPRLQQAGRRGLAFIRDNVHEELERERRAETYID